MKCRYDRDTGTYLADGEPCRTDEYGDPTHHCTATKRCTEHIGTNEQTCARCIGRTRTTIRRLPNLAAFAVPVANTTGINSAASVIAGPAANYAVFSARRAIDRAWIIDHIPAALMERAMRNLLEDDDPHHPLSVVGRWAHMIAASYGHDFALNQPTTVTGAADYLDRNLHRIAQDPDQDFALMARELRKCRQHMESVLATATRKERGAPCPECTTEETGVGARLVRHYGHWCDDDTCQRIHHRDDSGDLWVCPRNKEHTWTPEAYDKWIEERKERIA